jgi:hypothetical protein
MILQICETIWVLYLTSFVMTCALNVIFEEIDTSKMFIVKIWNIWFKVLLIMAIIAVFIAIVSFVWGFWNV